MMAENQSTPRSSRMKKKSALSRLAQKRSAINPEDSDSSHAARVNPSSPYANSDDSDEGIGMAGPYKASTRNEPLELRTTSPEPSDRKLGYDSTNSDSQQYSSEDSTGDVGNSESDDKQSPSSLLLLNQRNKPDHHSKHSIKVLENTPDDVSDLRLPVSKDASWDQSDLNEKMCHEEIKRQYLSILSEDGDCEDDLPEMKHQYASHHFGPSQSSHSPTHFHRNDSTMTTSSLYMSMAMRHQPAHQDDGMSQLSLQSTSVLPTISTKEARNRSFLVGSINSNGLLGLDELKRFFPERKMRIFIGTWNMCELKKISACIDDFLLPETSEYIHDVYVIGTQESTPNWEEWEIALQETLGPQHVLFHSAAFGCLYLNIFMHRELIWYCSVSEEDAIATRSGPSGIKTKGGVGVCFTLFGTSFLFVNSHFTPHDGKAKERAADFKKICDGLKLPKNLPKANVNGSNNDVTAWFDCVFWMGDLNFRLEKERERVDETVKGIDSLEVPSYDDLMEHDELFRLRNEGLAFQKFHEGRIKFRPTYKYDVGTNDFDTKKLRIPSYTDRILYRVRRKGQITCLHYDSAQAITASDHKPVYAMFEVDLRPGRDNIPLCGGQFKQNVWLEGNKRRASRMSVQSEKSSKICSVQ